MTLAHLMENAEERGRKEGEATGQKRGEARVNQLIQRLIQAGRIDDLERASKDEEFQRELFLEFDL